MSFSSTDVKRWRVKFHRVRKRSMMESTACCLIDLSLNSSLAKSINLNSSLLISSCACSVSLLKRWAAIPARRSVVSVVADRTIIGGYCCQSGGAFLSFPVLSLWESYRICRFSFLYFFSYTILFSYLSPFHFSLFYQNEKVALACSDDSLPVKNRF